MMELSLCVQWDPMITTLPGLYLVSVGLLKPVGVAVGLGLDTYCSTAWLRGINLLFILGVLYLAHRILTRLHHNDPVSTI